MSGPHNRAVPCPLCHEKFFPASLPFHQKQCQKRQSARVVPCPYCGTEVKQLDLPSHLHKCPKGASRSNAGKGGTRAPSQESRSRETAQPDGGHSEAAGQFEPEMLDDGRMRCVHCGRCFNQDRIDKHQTICGGLKSARPKGVDGQPTQTGRKVFNSVAQRVGKGPAFVTPEKYKRLEEQKAREVEKMKQTKNPSSTWRRAHESFVSACKAGRGSPSPTNTRASNSHGPPSGMVQCPHCCRQFNQDAADRHIPICAKVINRPKPPPSPNLPSRTIGPRNSQQQNLEETLLLTQSSASSSNPTPRFSASSSCGRLPVVDHGRSPSGSGMQAVRDLRSNRSVEKLPGLSSSPRRGPSVTKDKSGRTPSSSSRVTIRDGNAPPSNTTFGATRPPRTPVRQKSNATFLPHTADTTDGTPQSTNGHFEPQSTVAAPAAFSRIGLRRSAMLYRLLSNVQEEALTRELNDAGVTTDGLDHEGMIEAIVGQLS